MPTFSLGVAIDAALWLVQPALPVTMIAVGTTAGGAFLLWIINELRELL
ncbi:MAG: hypothetical protein GY803_30780 [Chloroflexi bacterium]|nr:hypothetical protein [Chloroflexota bacterium]